jgi:membrane fusion protein (multidrug efflux system)
MQTAKSDLENAQLNYSRCTITAPMAGVVRTLNVKVGHLLNSGDPVGQILSLDQLKAVVGIPESDINAVSGLDTVDITIQALNNRVITAKRHFLSSSPESIARLYRLELAIDNPDRDILPGMFFRANVVKKRLQNTLAVPFYSVISRNEERFVFVEKDGVALKRKVTLGIMEKWMVQVTEGLAPGDRLVVEGHRELENDQKINVVKVMSGLGDFNL